MCMLYVFLPKVPNTFANIQEAFEGSTYKQQKYYFYTLHTHLAHANS